MMTVENRQTSLPLDGQFGFQQHHILQKISSHNLWEICQFIKTGPVRHFPPPPVANRNLTLQEADEEKIPEHALPGDRWETCWPAPHNKSVVVQHQIEEGGATTTDAIDLSRCITPVATTFPPGDMLAWNTKAL